MQARGSEAKLPEVLTMLQEYSAHVTALVARIDANDRDGAQAAVLAYRDWVITLPSADAGKPAELARDAASARAKPQPAPAAVRELTLRALPLPDFARYPVRLRLLSLQLRLGSWMANDADPLRRGRLAAATAFVTHCTHLRLQLQDTDATLEAMQRTQEGLRLAGLDEQAAADAPRIEDLRRRRLQATSCRRFIETAGSSHDSHFGLLRIDPAPALVETTCRELGMLGQWLIGLTTGPGDAAMQAQCRRFAAGVGEVVRALGHARPRTPSVSPMRSGTTPSRRSGRSLHGRVHPPPCLPRPDPRANLGTRTPGRK